MNEEKPTNENYDWDAWIAVAPDTRQRGAEVLNRLAEGLPLSPREQGIAEYANKRCDEYRAMDFPDDALARVQVDLMGTFLCAADNTTGEMAEIAKMSDERPKDPEAAQ